MISEGSTNRTLGKFCGNQLPAGISLQGPATVRFVTDRSVVYKGFRVRFEVIAYFIGTIKFDLLSTMFLLNINNWEKYSLNLILSKKIAQGRDWHTGTTKKFNSSGVVYILAHRSYKEV